MSPNISKNIKEKSTSNYFSMSVLLEILVSHGAILFGVLTGNVQVYGVMLLYWWLTALKALSLLIRFATARFTGNYNRIFMLIFFAIHSGVFISLHLFFLLMFVPIMASSNKLSTGDTSSFLGFYSGLFNWNFLIAFILIFLSEAFYMFNNYYLKEGYKRASVNEGLLSLYGRIITIHITIIFGAVASSLFGPIGFGIIFIPLAAAIDYFITYHQKSRDDKKNAINEDRQDLPLLTDNFKVSDQIKSVTFEVNQDFSKLEIIQGKFIQIGELIESPVTKTKCIAYWYEVFVTHSGKNTPTKHQPAYFGFGYTPYKIQTDTSEFSPNFYPLIADDKEPTELNAYDFLSHPGFTNIHNYLNTLQNPLEKISLIRKGTTVWGMDITASDSNSIIPESIIEMHKQNLIPTPGIYNFKGDEELKDIRRASIIERVILSGEVVKVVKL